MDAKLAMHESLELHELMAFKNVCATKASTMSAMVQDPKLKSLMQKDAQTSTRHMQELASLLQNATIGGQ